MPSGQISKRSPSGSKKISLEKLGIIKKSPVKSKIKRAEPRDNQSTSLSEINHVENTNNVLNQLSLLQSELSNDLLSNIDLIHRYIWRSLPETRSAKLGLSVAKFRAALPHCVLKSQLMGLDWKNATLVEKELYTHTNEGQVRIILINGGLGGEMVVESTYFYKVMETTFNSSGTSDSAQSEESEETDTLHAYRTFRSLLESRPSAATLSEDDLKAAGLDSKECRAIVNCGFLTLSTDMNQMKTFELSMPNVGTLMRLVKIARKWMFDSLKNRRNCSMAEASLQTKWCNSKDLWNKMKGMNLAWVLLDCYGGGWIEPFNTPVGQHWKLTGKKL